MSKDNPYGLVVNVENATCVVEFDIIHDEVNYETWEVFYHKDFKVGVKHTLLPHTWVQVNDLISNKAWESIDDQIKAQWKDVEEQQRAYYEYY